MGQDIFDLVIVITLIFFTLRGVSNGLIGEVAGIGALIGGIWAARNWNGEVSRYLEFIKDPSLRMIAAYSGIFIAVMLGVGLTARILKKICSWSFIGWLDKLGGAVLGLAKGLLLWSLIIIILQNMIPDAPFMRDSRTLPYLKQMIDLILPWIPETIAKKIHL